MVFLTERRGGIAAPSGFCCVTFKQKVPLRIVTIYFFSSSQKRIKIMAVSARDALLCGRSLPLEP